MMIKIMTILGCYSKLSTIRGQNSDGLGESFEQQGFEGDDYEEDDYGNYCDMAEFDWATNKYPLRKKN